MQSGRADHIHGGETHPHGFRPGGVVSQPFLRHPSAEVVRLRKALADRDVQLREIDHRAKNTLQLAAAMLLLQRRTTDDPGAGAALADAARKLAVLAEIHQRMYDTEQDDAIDLKSWVAKVCDGFALRPGFQVEVSCPDAAWPFERALPLGLFIGEALANALKHGVSDPSGRISVLVHEVDPRARRWRVWVADDGDGLNDPPKPGMGLKILSVLAGQLGGSLATGPGLDGRGFGAGVVFTLP